MSRSGLALSGETCRYGRGLAVVLGFGVLATGGGVAQGNAPVRSTRYTEVCTLLFDRDAKRPTRVQDDASACLAQAGRALKSSPRDRLVLVATADRNKDDESGHGTARVEQDMNGEDVRYADVAAYRAVNTKAYLVRYLHVDARRIVPLTTYEDGQWLRLYLVPNDVDFKSAYGKATAPILMRPCTVAPCARGAEEYLLAQPRGPIPGK